MQLDRTLIAVHERSLLETLDLALHVVHRYAWPLIVTFAMGAVPIAVINHLLVAWMLDFDQSDALLYSEEPWAIARYLWEMTALVFITAPLASIFMTKFLGDAVFVERPSLRSVWRFVNRLLHRVIWCQLILRGVLATWFVFLSLERDSEFHIGLEFFALGALIGYSATVRALRPFINEIVLLECNPLRSRDEMQITIRKRNSHLHSPSSGDLISQWMGSACIAFLLTCSVFGFFLFCSGVFFNDWQPGRWMLLTVYPLSLWVVAWFMAIVRFLRYLDLRIRHEGWETELLLRAEATRLAGRVV